MEYVPAKHLLHRSRSTEWFGAGHLYDMKSIIRAATLGYGDRQITFFD